MIIRVHGFVVTDVLRLDGSPSSVYRAMRSLTTDGATPHRYGRGGSGAMWRTTAVVRHVANNRGCSPHGT